jgi:hypothetical protein
MPQPWSDDAIRHLQDGVNCPRCGVDGLADHRCLNCGADLRGEIAERLWAASVAAVEALQARQAVLDAVPVSPVEVRAAAPAAGAASAAATVGADAVAEPAAQRASATVQSVLAVAGAGLFAVAAIVFTFFNPQLTDHVLRSVIVGIVTIVFLGGAWLLARRSLQFSAEAVGALGMVFVALDVYALSEAAPDGVSGWVFTAIGTLVSGVVMVIVGVVARIRSWLLVALAGLTFVPAMAGYAGYDAGYGLWVTVLGHIGSAFAVLALLEVARKAQPRFDSALRADRVVLTVLQIAAGLTVLVQLPLAQSPTPAGYWVSVAASLAALSLSAFLATRHLIRAFWSFAAGGLSVAAVAVLPFALALADREWYFALAPAAAAVALVGVALVPTPPRVARTWLTAGALTVAGAASVTTLAFGALVVVFRALSFTRVYEGVEDPFGVTGGISIVLGLLGAAAGLGAFAAIGWRRARNLSGGLGVASAVAVSLLMLGALAFASWSAWLPLVQVGVAIAIALVSAVGLLAVPPLRSASAAVRIPVIVGAHAALVLAALLSWGEVARVVDPAWTVYSGIAIVAVFALLARTVRTADHPIHWGAGYAYSLVLVARALDLLNLSTPAVFAITTAVGAAAAIAATLVRRLRAPAWYAVLIVTAVPFLIGVGVVVLERSGWAALSSGMIFLLALTLMLTRRPGLNVGLRAVAAGLLVPTLAVVITNLFAQLLPSGSPYALPVIAVVVAGVLPSTGLIRSGLVRHGLPEREARLARVFIEGSALLTGAIAVLLSLLRSAAGLDTSFIVLLVLGVGATATAIWARRRYAWWVAFASYTGALWSLWALRGVTGVEPYLLPPALAIAVIGVIVTARGARGLPLYASGLGVATVPVLGILAVTGTPENLAVPLRAYALLGGAWVLLLIGTVIGRGSREWMTRLAVLRVPTLLIAIIAGSAGAIQGLRYGLHADRLAADGLGRLTICLALGAAGALAAAAAARAVIDDAPDSRWGRSRWMYAPAALYVVLSVVALKPGHFDWASIWTMWALMFLLLAFMIVIVLRARRTATTLPPVWFVFVLAFVVSIVGWSARDLWVETFSVPMGLMLLGAGVLGMIGADGAPATARSLNSWPIGFRGSWPLLAPGIVVLFLASVFATGTNPMVWRAVGVIVVALLAILVGAQLKLAAPFFVGIIVLPIENILVFVVQLARGIDSVPWWITLAVVGAVLLIIAVTYERRSGADGSIAARVRDLR